MRERLALGCYNNTVAIDTPCLDVEDEMYIYIVCLEK